jgi:hypothetical protein
MNTKGQQLGMNALKTMAISLVIVGIVIVVGIDINSNLSSDYDTDSAAHNTTKEVQDGFDKLATWLPTIALVVAAAVVIGIVVNSMGGI